jgi:mannose-6-phosphate isomerase-like protein (cupin superfamily)
MANKQGKVWGNTTEILTSDTASIHYLEINEGGYCSEHYHKSKHNLFYVIEGELEVNIFRDLIDKSNSSQIKDTTLLTAGMVMNVDPGFFHQFIAKTNVKCIEIYTPELISSDIVRRSVGGIIE